MKFAKHLVLVMAAMLVAGCTSGGGGSVNFSQTKGADIIDFGFDTPYIEDFGDQAVLTVGFQNVGGKTMSGDTQLFIYNAPMTDDPATEPKKWNIVSPTGTEVVKVNGTVSRLVWTLSGATFYPPDPQTGQPGMANNYIVILTPPNQDEGMVDIPYTFETRLCYPYKTTTSSIIRATAQDSYVTSDDTQRSLAETQASAGPIQISLKAGQNIRANIGGGTVQIPLVFEVRDVGGGFATDTAVSCTPLVTKAQIGALKATVYIDGVAMDCGTGDLYIRNGVGNLYCTGSFTNSNPKSEYHITAQTSYNYYVSRAATIKVSDSKDMGDVDAA
ncbi:MAG: hypothetical protein KAJ24_03350 [Candidatus Aenigmarchaeota archaeon]|nr:hypothetical protein [Candidatus Aenigmarchaeota archaeon]